MRLKASHLDSLLSAQSRIASLRFGTVHDSLPSPQRKRGFRTGMTLLEVVVSLAIFLFALAAIYQLLSLSGANVMEAAVRTRAAMLCQSKMAEVQAGAVSIEGGSGWATFPDDSSPGFEWMMTSAPNEDVPGSLLYNVQISVKKDVPGRGSIEVSLGQMVLDCSKKGSTLDPAIPAANTSAGQ